MTAWLKTGAAACALIAVAAPAFAHTSYLLPSTFATTEGEHVTLEVSFTEKFFTPEVAVLSDDYHLYRPDGSRDDYDNIVPFRQLTVLESDLTEPGTYRFSTGERLGVKSRRALVDGEWTRLAPDEEPPANATEVVNTQTETVADVYVSKGAPTRAAVDLTVGRLAIHPITHPNEIYLDGGFEFQLTFDGNGFAEQDMLLYREGGAYEEPKYEHKITTDADGHVALTFDAPGVYLIMTRHRADAPEGSETSERSYTTSLTFEVTR